jgi:hypothetical protein
MTGTPPSRSRASRAEVLATLAIVVGLGAFVALRSAGKTLAPHPSRDECSALLDRYVDHLAHAAEPKPAASTIAERTRVARSRAEKDPEFATCAEALTREQAACAMNANDADQFERCLQ